MRYPDSRVSNLLPSFPALPGQWIWEFVTRHSGATVPESHRVPAIGQTWKGQNKGPTKEPKQPDCLLPPRQDDSVMASCWGACGSFITKAQAETWLKAEEKDTTQSAWWLDLSNGERADIMNAYEQSREMGFSLVNAVQFYGVQGRGKTFLK